MISKYKNSQSNLYGSKREKEINKELFQNQWLEGGWPAEILSSKDYKTFCIKKGVEIQE